MTQTIGNYPETDWPGRAMRRTATTRDVAVGWDMHDYDDVSAKRRRTQLPTRESEIAWSLHDGNVAFAADYLNNHKCHLPWETGYAGMVLSNRMPKLFHLIGDDPMQVGRADFIRGAASSSSVVSHIALLPKLPGHVRCLKLMSWHVEPDDLKRRALGLVRIMIESDLSATQVGKIMHDMAYNLSEEHRIRQLLEDTFAKKSPATLYKRARSFWKYFEWMKGSYSEALHLSEARIYGYVCHLRESSAAPTSAKAFLESVNFFSHVLGFTACDINIAVSSRVKGAVYNMSLLKRPLRQARALLAKEVAALESLVLQPSCPVIGIMAGFFLFCVLNCCRFSDAQFSTALQLDDTDGFVVLHSGTYQHKTATSADKRTTLLPLVCLGHAFASESWAVAWILLMQTAGWPEDRGYLLPAYSEYSGRWLSRRMTSGEGSLWLRECLAAADIEVLDMPRLPSTHSCKATLLSWLAKSGKFDMSERQIMGHHLDRPSVSALTYGRQNFIPILTKVAILFKRIKDGEFSPDAPVSRIIKESLAQMEAESAVHQETLGLDVQQNRDDMSDCSASDVDDQEDVEISIAKVVPDVERRVQPVVDPILYEQHRLSGILHFSLDDHKFLCGRVRGLNYLPCDEASTLGLPLCEQCRASKLSSANRNP